MSKLRRALPRLTIPAVLGLVSYCAVAAASQHIIAREESVLIPIADTTAFAIARTLRDNNGTSIAESDLYWPLVGSGRRDVSDAFAGLFIVNEHRGAARGLTNGFSSYPLDLVLTNWRTSITVITGSSVVLFAILVFAWRRRTRAYRRERQSNEYLSRLNLALERQTELAEESARTKTAFLANMSHEIRTPLNGIIGYSGMALEDSTLSEESRRFIKHVFNAGNYLRVIIDDILDLSKIESGTISLFAVPFALADVADNCRSIIEPLAKAKGLDLRVLLDPKAPARVVGDEIRVQQALLNLAYNAIKFTEKGWVEIAIACEKIADGQTSLRFTVRDTGIGIADDKVVRLFGHFKQADSSFARRYGGTGLGLAISNGLVKFMGGEIGVESVLGRGSTFWFALSLTVATEAAVPETIAPQGEGVPGASLRILVVDDIAMNCDLAQTLLERAGHSVDTVSDGGSAVHACARNAYDLVLMDVQMPGMDGMEATRQIRGLGEAGRTMPIVAMTANLMPEQVALYRTAGMNGCLGKPIDRGQLFAVLERWSNPVMGKPDMPETPAAGCVHDPARLDEVRGMLGLEKTRGFLRTLQDNLAGDIWADEAIGTQNLVRAAHVTVSLAGQLGFSELSAAARDLEEAILDSADAKAALASFNVARTRATPLVTELVQSGEPECVAAAAAGT